MYVALSLNREWNYRLYLKKGYLTMAILTQSKFLFFDDLGDWDDDYAVLKRLHESLFTDKIWIADGMEKKT